ncbi:MAG: type I restriction endonuclease subunit R [Christensenellaceae bacterium]|jgi:type I restriction enzyme R subunit|nr:type I restriction endonuclease subunit R [Christensenellaceae bacterium]
MIEPYNESNLENLIIDHLISLGYSYGTKENKWATERNLDSFVDKNTLLERLEYINKNVKHSTIDEAIKSIINIDIPSLFAKNHKFHNYLTNGISIEDSDAHVNPLVQLIDFDEPNNNKFEVYNQLKFQENHSMRRLDIVIYINGMPLVVFELKSSRDGTFLTDAFNQLGKCSESDGYRYDIPSLFVFNAFLVLSNGATSLVGTLTSDYPQYSEWKSSNGENRYENNYSYKLNVLLNGMFDRARLLDIIKNYLFFMHKDKEKPIKILAKYHQYFGVLKAFKSITTCKKPNGDGRAGIIWHTQGSGKSFSMVMLAHRLITDITFKNPTIIIMTDRNELDNQLFSTFSNAEVFLRTTPVMVESRSDLLSKISEVKKGGIFFTTIQKIDKENITQNMRDNIIVFSDEAHRSHYGIDEKIQLTKNTDNVIIPKLIYGYEKHIREALPNATFLGFTGTPVETREHSTSDIFGNVIDTYDMTQSVEDGTTVKLFYERRVVNILLDDKTLKETDKYYNSRSDEGVPDETIEKSKKSMSRLETIVGAPNRLQLVAEDIYAHYSDRRNTQNGKAMIVCMNRKIAFDLYNLFIKIKPELEEQTVIIVTESNKDSKEMRDLFRNSKYRKSQTEEFKKSDSKLKIMIVVDMCLTGYDVTDLDVMYIDKRMEGHTLMQAVARANRVHTGKGSGLIVDYIGIEDELRKALNQYTDRDKRLNLRPIKDLAEEIIEDILSDLDKMFETIDNSDFFTNDDILRFKAIQSGADFVLSNDIQKIKYFKLTKQLKEAYIIARGVLDDISKNKVLYYITIRDFVQKLESDSRDHKFNLSDINKNVEILISEAIKADGVKILTQTNNSGDNHNTWDILEDTKIDELQNSYPPHVFVTIMARLLNDALQDFRISNLAKANVYSELLKATLKKYNESKENHETHQLRRVSKIHTPLTEDNEINLIILQLKDLAKQLHLYNHPMDPHTQREQAFYDALVTEKDISKLIKDDTLRMIAKELRQIVEEYATVDWQKKVNTRARMKLKIKQVLKNHEYPNTCTEKTASLVLRQAELIQS